MTQLPEKPEPGMNAGKAAPGARLFMRHTGPMVVGLILAGLMVALAGGCSEPELSSGSICRSNSDCAEGLVCKDSFCQCSSDSVCELGEFCNTSGTCQKRIGCTNTFECPSGFICDLSSGNCIEQDKCTTDIQCPLGSVCDPRRFQCVNGCRSIDDCVMGDLCELPSASSSALGECKRGPCAGDEYCRMGERCVDISDDDTPDLRCVRDTSGPYCGTCENKPGQSSQCGDSPANFCLIDSSKPYGFFFCGVDCSQASGEENPCPNGFSCNDVRILMEGTCESDAQCRTREPNGCKSDSDCPGGACDKATGSCRSVCLLREGAQTGGCTCLEDTDCPQEVCNAGFCSVSGQPCDPTQPDSCGTARCVHVEVPHTERSHGYCRIGRNCAPRKGVTCDMVNEQRR